MKTWLAICLGFLAVLQGQSAPGHIILLNGTSSAGKSSLAEAMVTESKTKYKVVSFDDFLRANRGKQQDMMTALYRHAKEESEAGHHVIIDTVEFDRAYEKYCAILDCPKVVKAVVYCPLPDILKRVERRNNSGDPSNRRPVLLSFQQFLEMYKPQTSPDELVVERTSTGVIRAALAEAGRKANNPKQYDALYKNYVQTFGIDRDREVVIVPKGRYDLVLHTRANTKKENVRRVEDYLKSRR